MRRFLLVLSFLVILPLAPCAPAQSAVNAAATPAAKPVYGQKLKLAGLPNAGKIDDVLYRGAQPHKEGFAELKKLGIGTIVDLRAEDHDKILWEQQQAEALGIRFVRIPVDGWSAPSSEQVAQFLVLFREPSSGKVFVHCHYGHDRTGVFVAAYRIALKNWTADQAIQEMNFFGFSNFWHPVMKSYVRDFPALLKSSPDLAKFADKPDKRLPVATDSN